MTGDDNGIVLTDLAPGTVRRIHLVGVAGTGMGAFAGMLKAAGYDVTGSDENVYPPMSDMLREWGIEVFTPYASGNLDRARPDVVIIGNVVRRVNPEATAAREGGIPQISFPAAFGALILPGRHSVVIAGTHGKTTTAALMAHVLVEAGLDPTFLVGGVTVNYGGNFRLGGGEHVVIEGDEDDTAYFDKGPKFLPHRPPPPRSSPASSSITPTSTPTWRTTSRPTGSSAPRSPGTAGSASAPPIPWPWRSPARTPGPASAPTRSAARRITAPTR